MNLQFFLDNAWRRSVGAKEKEWGTMPTLDSLRESEKNPEFDRLALNRKIFGAFRYQLFKDKKGLYNYTDRMKKLLEEYVETGNDELLLDIRNYCELQFTRGYHPNKHFKAVDDGNHAQLR